MGVPLGGLDTHLGGLILIEDGENESDKTVIHKLVIRLRPNI